MEDDASGKTKHTLPIDLVDSDDDIYAEDEELEDTGVSNEDENLTEDRSTGEVMLTQNLLLKSVIEKGGKFVIQCQRCDFEHICTKMPSADDVSHVLSPHVVKQCPSTVNAREKLGNADKLDCKLSSEYKLSASFEHRINSNLRLFAFYMFRLKMMLFHDFRSFSKTPSYVGRALSNRLDPFAYRMKFHKASGKYKVDIEDVLPILFSDNKWSIIDIEAVAILLIKL